MGPDPEKRDLTVCGARHGQWVGYLLGRIACNRWFSTDSRCGKGSVACCVVSVGLPEAVHLVWGGYVAGQGSATVRYRRRARLAASAVGGPASLVIAKASAWGSRALALGGWGSGYLGVLLAAAVRG